MSEGSEDVGQTRAHSVSFDLFEPFVSRCGKVGFALVVEAGRVSW
jgi:hypothetical protein